MPPPCCDVAVSLRSHEAGRAGHALKQTLQKRGLRVVLCDESPRDDAETATIRALHGCKMAVMLGTETYGKRFKGGFSTLQQLRYIVDEETPFLLIKMCDDFLEPEARLRFTRDTPHFPWRSEQDRPDIVVPADLVNEIVARVQLPEKSQEGGKSLTPTKSGKREEAFADSTRHLDLADKDKSDTLTTEHTCEQPAPGLLSLADAGFPGETDTDADPSTALGRHGAAPAPTTSGVDGVLCDTPEGGGNSDQGLYESISGIDGLEIYGASRPAAQLASGSAPLALPNCNRKMSTSSAESVRPVQNLLVFEIDTSGRSNPANQRHGRYKQLCFIILLGLCVVVGIAAAMSITAFGVASGSGSPNGTEALPPSFPSSPPTTTTTTTATASSTTSSSRTSTCNGSTTATLDCGDPTSRSQFADTGLCEASAVVNCCCDEFYDLKRVFGSVSVLASLELLRFGNVASIGGDVLAPDGALSSVEFGGLTHVAGHVNLSGNSLTSINLEQLTHVEGDLVLGDNTGLTSISFGTLANVGGNLDLSGNALSSVDFTPLLSVGGRLGLHYNALSGVNFATLTRVGGRLDLHSNVLTNVAFGNLTRVAGDLYVRDNNLTSIDFGHLTHVEGGLHLLDATLTLTNGTVQGDMDFVNKGLLAFDFGALTCVEGGVDLSGNSLRSVEFGSLNKVIGWMSLRNNSITNIDFGSITGIGGRLDLRSNSLTSIDCGGVSAECTFADDGVTNINCPVKC